MISTLSNRDVVKDLTATGLIIVSLVLHCIGREQMLGFAVVFLAPCALAYVCGKRDTCHYPDTKLLGVPFLDISTRDIHPQSCITVCLFTDGCIGATRDPLKEMCHLYDESISFGMTEDPGVHLWLFQAAGVPCIKVGKTTKIIWSMRNSWIWGSDLY